MTWFSRVVWVGIAANLCMAIPGLIAPEKLLALFSLPQPNPPMWTSFASQLLILLSLFYMFAAIDPVRYRANAWLAIISRLAGVIFFCLFHRTYILFGLFDLAFLIPQATLLILATRE